MIKMRLNVENQENSLIFKIQMPMLFSKNRL
jgi:hypothetical protein